MMNPRIVIRRMTILAVNHSTSEAIYLLMCNSGKSQPLLHCNTGGIVKGGCFLSCLYPPLTRKNIMKKNTRNYKVDFFRYNGDSLELWKCVYFEHLPSLQWLMSELDNFYDSFSVSKVK